jgi:LPXTG-motif cell wall-anchored protein
MHRQDEEAIVRNPVRKFMGVALVGVLGALFALPMLTAGAQTAATNGSAGSNGVNPVAPGACNVTSVTPTPPVAPGTQLTISGTAPSTDNTHVFLFVDGTPAQVVGGTNDVVDQAVTDGTFTLKYTVQATVTLTVNFTYGNQNAYSTGCTFFGVGAEFVASVQVAGENVAQQPQAAALAFTGSSNTPSYILIGIAALVLGAVLVVAARRRSQVS